MEILAIELVKPRKRSTAMNKPTSRSHSIFKKALNYFIAFGIGAIIASFFMIIAMNKMSSTAFKEGKEMSDLEFEQIVYDAYMKEDPTVSEWALNSLADYYKGRAMLYEQTHWYSRGVILAYGRLAKISQENGTERRAYIDKALGLAKYAMPREIGNENELFAFVENMEQIKPRKAVSDYLRSKEAATP